MSRPPRVSGGEKRSPGRHADTRAGQNNRGDSFAYPRVGPLLVFSRSNNHHVVRLKLPISIETYSVLSGEHFALDKTRTQRASFFKPWPRQRRRKAAPSVANRTISISQCRMRFFMASRGVMSALDRWVSHPPNRRVAVQKQGARARTHTHTHTEIRSEYGSVVDRRAGRDARSSCL